MKRASVSDVSKRAGVSTATVSRVLNSPEMVAEGTRQRVLAAIEELNFVKNAKAFSFKSQQTNNILVACTNIGNVYYSKVFEGLQRRAGQHGYNIILKAPEATDGQDPVIEYLRTGNVDGVVSLDGYLPAVRDLALLTDLFQGTPPMAGVAEAPGYLPYPHIFLDNRTAARTMVEHLIACGHRHIGYQPPPDHMPVNRERLSGFIDGMKAAGLDVDPDDIYQAGFDPDAGRLVARYLVERGSMPSAVFCANDEAAMGFISEMAALGIRVPEDISVAGFDDNVFADAYVPPLTTMAQPREEIGIAAMDLLLDVMREPEANTDRVVELKIRLVSRFSVARVKPDGS